MIPFFSKRNQVYGVLWNDQPAVEKHFCTLSDWVQETTLYSTLESSAFCPKVLHTEPGILITEYFSYPTLLAELDRQEQEGFSSAPWLALVQWLQACHSLSGQLPGEGNLRNFLWDPSGSRIVGLDLEGFRPTSPDNYGAVLIAALLDYAPVHTQIKQQAAALLSEQLQVSAASLEAACRSLQEHRTNQPQAQPVSGIVLAGGASKRMGQSKAHLQLLGTSLLARQVEKLRRLGISDILLSGENCPPFPGTRVIADEYPNRGPLGGLHACLRAAQNPRCLVLSVDVPLVPLSALAHLCRFHRKGATVLCHGAAVEPLIGVYDKSISSHIEPLIQQGGVPVRALKDSVFWNTWNYLGPETLLHNCNTPQDFSYVESLVVRYANHSLPF